MEQKILIIEDEPKLASLLKDYVVANGFTCHVMLTGDGAVEHIQNESYDFILLDLMLPGQDGLSICKEVRTFSDVPIIMLTAKIEEIDRLLGLELGADDYICKPYSPREVIARIKAVLRRYQKSVTQIQQSSGLFIEESKLKVCWHGNDLQLTAIEFNLLMVMFRSPGQIFNREQLMSGMYRDQRVVSERSIDSHIKKLRKKILSATQGIDWIKSVYGVGYKFELTESGDV